MASQTSPDELMETLLSRAGTGPIGLLLDYDGTLADIVARPDLARMPRDTHTALERLGASERVRVAIVTGRARAGLEAVAGRFQHVFLAVNGGLQIFSDRSPWTHPEAVRARGDIARAVSTLRAAVGHWPGAILEDKELSLTVHYRQNPGARQALHDAGEGVLREAGGALRLLSGKESYEIQPNINWDKGRAAAVLLEQWQSGPGSLFLGDDRIDEPAFAAMRARDAMACRVGAHFEDTLAEWTLPSPADVRVTIARLCQALNIA